MPDPVRTRRTHNCPACRTPGVPDSRLACVPCWYRLPADLRGRVWNAYDSRNTHPRNHALAVRAAITWYRENSPTTEAVPS